MKNKIYAILVFTRLEQDETGFPNLGSEDLVGYYFNKDYAFEAVENNYQDIAECCYHYALIEEVEEGLYNPALNRWLFEYDHINDKFVQIQEPEYWKNMCGFTIS